MKRLSREEILSARDLAPKEVEVPEWGGAVHVRLLTLGERLEAIEAIRGDGDVTLKLLALALCDDAGARLFADGDLEALKGKNGDVLQRLALEALRHNRMARADADELEKNS